MMSKTILVLCSVMFLTACGAGDDLVGTWQVMLVGSPGISATRVTFGADGSYSAEASPGPGQPPITQMGTYKVSGDVLTVEVQSGMFRGRTTSKYKSNGELMTLAAQSPQGAHQGIVGTWTATVSSDVLEAGGSVVQSIQAQVVTTLRQDQTVTLSTKINGAELGGSAYTGTYTGQGEGPYTLSFDKPAMLKSEAYLLGPETLASSVYRRQ